MKRLLVVDDHEENLYLLRVLLESQGHGVELARNGAEALDKARREPPDLVISDILMPVMDGFTLCRNWRADERLRQIPFIFYTATYTDAKDEQLALELGSDAFITKPAEPEVFMDVIQEVVDRAEAGRLGRPSAPESEDESILKAYSEVLVRKLEEKALKLEKANEALEREAAERRRVEEDSRESEERYLRLADRAPDIIFRYDVSPTMALTYINPAVYAVTGYTPEECYADPQLMLNMAHPDDAPIMADLMRSLTLPGRAGPHALDRQGRGRPMDGKPDDGDS